MNIPQCPNCHWPIILSSTYCSICSCPVSLGPTRSTIPFQEECDSNRPLFDRALIHGVSLGLILLGWLILPQFLFRLELLFAGLYGTAVAVWSFVTAQRIPQGPHSSRLIREAFLFVGIGVLFICGSVGSSASPVITTAGIAAHQETSQQLRAEDPEQARIRMRGDRTAEYMTATEQISATFATIPSSSDELMKHIDQAIEALEGISTNGVDTDAVEYLFAMTNYFRLTQQYNRRYNNPSIVVESFVRGALGDPLGVPTELEQSRSAVAQEWERLQGQRKKLLAILSARYNRKFP